MAGSGTAAPGTSAYSAAASTISTSQGLIRSPATAAGVNSQGKSGSSNSMAAR